MIRESKQEHISEEGKRELKKCTLPGSNPHILSERSQRYLTSTHKKKRVRAFLYK